MSQPPKEPCIPCGARKHANAAYRPVYIVTLDDKTLSKHDSPMKARQEAIKIPGARVRISSVANTPE